MAKTKIAVGNLGAEELAQFKWTVRNRSDTQMEADALFGKNPEVRKKDRAILEKLFIQTPASTTNAPNLQKTAGVKCTCPKTNCPACKKQKTSAIDAYTAQHEKAKLSSAQVRYPELLKVAAPAPILPKKINTDAKTGPTPAQSSLAGGSA
jgi:hypothetical protein